MNTENPNSVRKWIVTGAAIAAAGIAALAYFLPRDGATKPPNIEVNAEGADSIAAGRDVNIKERNTIDKHDYDSDRRRDAELYLRTARESCQSLATKIAALDSDSRLDMASMAQYNPPELDPAEVIAQEYGEKVYNDISTRVDQTRENFKPVSRVLVANSIMPLTGAAQRREAGAKQRASFDSDRKAWLDNTIDLCTYLGTVRKAGA